ncbi:transcriptional regulator, TetR family [Hathewaya proteolytica DSM 3090]|uniref:Transcriptional regulator, TetR family n=1 Tax=Hathewaya proteolytica DSM 3090 TaxID=1121331 RepID=A0A1M6RHJ7_9CLOT|nr:TetR/AcrR family transcriptional regulator [Hathewaya proteolytica]SHK31945.1 transcriptional regulator, TetR family [Hathewaya proteolytica DSM 3090]
MNKTDISNEKIIEVSIDMLKGSEVPDLNMRHVAKKCNISVGTIYNYFPTKSELMIAVIQEVWSRVFHGDMLKPEVNEPFTQYISSMYKRAFVSQKEYRNFFVMHRNIMDSHSKNHGRIVMEKYIGHIKQALTEKLRSDENISKEIWTKEFSHEKLVDFIFENMVSMLSKGQDNCEFLIMVLNKILYTK